MQSFTSTYRVIRPVFGPCDNGYTIYNVRDEKSGRFINAVGYFAEKVNNDDVVEITGHYSTHPKYGKQIVVDSFRAALLVSEDALTKYLGSGIINGIGPQLAQRIVKHFGKQTADVLDKEPERLCEIHGIGKVKAASIVEQWNLQNASRMATTFLMGFGVTPNLALKIYRKYRDRTIEVVKNNPYVLADDIDGVGFKKADDIAIAMGYPLDSVERCQAGTLFTLHETAVEGSTFEYADKLIEDTVKLLHLDKERGPELIRSAIRNLGIPDGEGNIKLIQKEDRVYLPWLFRDEVSIARDVWRIMHYDCSLYVDEDLDVAQVLEDAGMEPDEVQEQAVREAIQSKIMILTGGPGTGKTTTLRSIIRIFQEAHGRILLAAPTGRASRRMKEATGIQAQTIHRLLEYSPDGKFNRDRKDPLYGDVLIVDESSMIDTSLMAALLEAVPEGMRVIFVGDSNQLPSVGPGNVLHDMINSNVVPVVRLTRIFRQAMDSQIVTNAHAIIDGHMPDLVNRDGGDFFFEEQNDPSMVEARIVDLASRILPAYFNVTQSEIQVLSPKKEGQCGIYSLNALIQDRVNPDDPGKKSLKSGDSVYRAGDRVMQLRNNYEKGVFNGDVGTVFAVQDGRLLVSFESANDEDDDNLVVYEPTMLSDLTHAYACTVHKSQGSEYPIVVVPMITQHEFMLKRNLLYTAVTRAKQAIVLVGSKDAISSAVRNSSVEPRQTTLRKYLEERFER